MILSYRLPSQAAVIAELGEKEDGPRVALRSQPFASPEKLHDIVAETYRNLKNRKSNVQKSMALYLANKDTEYILFKPIKVCSIIAEICCASVLAVIFIFKKERI